MKTKTPRTAVLYGRIKGENKKWLSKQAKRRGYKSLSEFMDEHIEFLKTKVKDDRKQDWI